jgi:hypothetical protein
MNLDNLNIVELNAQEIQKTEGGALRPIPWGWVLSAALFTYDVVVDLHDEFVKSYKPH